jgi:HK97 family phage prohead protease
MKLKHRQFAFDLKKVSNTGTFEGYGSVFGNADHYRDVVMPGAFSKSLAAWAEKDKLPPILWQHNSAQPIGPFTHMSEDGTGLYCEGQLLIKDVQQAREAYALMKSGAISGMSIGYNVVNSDYDGKTNVNQLTDIDLWECSIVTFPANTEANVTSIKSLVASGELPTLAEFEDFLRDAGNFSRSQAKAIAGHGLRGLLEQRDADTKQIDTETTVDSILALIRDTPLKL